MLRCLPLRFIAVFLLCAGCSFNLIAQSKPSFQSSADLTAKKSIYNELLRHFNEKNIAYLEHTENPLMAILYSSYPERVGTLIFVCPLVAEIETGEKLPWFHRILMDYLDAANSQNVNFDIFLIFTYSDPEHILYTDLDFEEDADFAAQLNLDIERVDIVRDETEQVDIDQYEIMQNLNLRFILDSFDTDDKVVVIDTAFYNAPSKINIQKSGGTWNPPLEIAKHFFKECVKQNISSSYTKYEKSRLELNIVDWDYDFPVISLNAKYDKSTGTPIIVPADLYTKKTISKDSMTNLLLEYSKQVMQDSGTDYSRHYFFIGLGRLKILIPEFVLVLSLLFGSALVFFILHFKLALKFGRHNYGEVIENKIK
ncbi:MAG: hypothetical protein Ta2B_09020 [Termitinemataceae bacterium]|nr:MAG: hypothetical protein Ta2B_09020 [Termitinemataceae bacterium]